VGVVSPLIYAYCIFTYKIFKYVLKVKIGK